MEYNVRRHTRRTPKGRSASVRQHTRRSPGGESTYPAPEIAWSESPDVPVGEDQEPETDWTVPEDAGTREGQERYDRLMALRDAGYDGPVDQDGNPTGRKELFKARYRLLGEKEKAQERFSYASTISERDAAGRDFKAASDRLKVLPGALDRDLEAMPPRHRRRPALDSMRDSMREWRSRPEPQPSAAGPMDPQLAKALGCDTPEGRARYERGRAYREAGYDGPLDRDNRIPDPDDPANAESLSALAMMRERSGG